jgi:cytochrome c oxidase subunit 3
VLALSAIAMLFAAVTSSYIVRQGMGSDWNPIPMPSVMPFSTVLLLLSSATLELARRALRRSPGAVRAWVRVTLALGAVFLGGQFVAWRQLAAEGFFLSSTAHSSFFYTLTAMHGFHILGGLAALGYLARGALEGSRLARWVDVTALYWHFMDGLWLYLLVLLFAWR